MSDNLYEYPFDPYARLESNYVEDLQVLSSINPETYNYIIPKQAPFYRKDLEVIHVASGYPLQEGLDFQLGHQYETASLNTSMPVFGSIIPLRNDLTGAFRIKARTVGGIWNLDEQQLTLLLASTHLNPRIVHLEDIVDWPIEFPPVDHMQPVDDLTGAGEIIQGLSDIADAILARVNQDEEEAENPGRGFAQQYVYPLLNYDVPTWTLLGYFNVEQFPASDLVFTLAGAEPIGAPETSLYMITMGVRGGVRKMSVMNLSQYSGGCRFGHRFNSTTNCVEIWCENVPHRGLMTVTVLSRVHHFMMVPTTVTEAPAGLTQPPIFEVGGAVAQNSLRLGGIPAIEYVTRAQLSFIMADITSKLDDLAAGPPANPPIYPASYFVSMAQYTYTLADLTQDITALGDYLNGVFPNIPTLITQIPTYLSEPTGQIDYFAPRMMFIHALGQVQSTLNDMLDDLANAGLITDVNGLKSRIQPGTAIVVPYAPGIEETTQTSASLLVSVTEFSQILGEIIYVNQQIIAAIS